MVAGDGGKSSEWQLVVPICPCIKCWKLRWWFRNLWKTLKHWFMNGDLGQDKQRRVRREPVWMGIWGRNKEEESSRYLPYEEGWMVKRIFEYILGLLSPHSQTFTVFWRILKLWICGFGDGLWIQLVLSNPFIMVLYNPFIFGVHSVTNTLFMEQPLSARHTDKRKKQRRCHLP